MQTDRILSIERPHPKLLTYYLIISCLLPPFSLLALPMLYFRYHTMRYRFDDEGVSMSWGILIRRQVNLTYARIQDIHLTSGVIQRWLGLADLHIQTASGSADSEMKIEGVLEYELLRDFLYTRMRGYRDRLAGGRDTHSPAPPPVPSASDTELVSIMREIQSEIRQVRETLQARNTAPTQEDGR